MLPLKLSFIHNVLLEKSKNHSLNRHCSVRKDGRTFHPRKIMNCCPQAASAALGFNLETALLTSGANFSLSPYFSTLFKPLKLSFDAAAH